MEINDVWIEKGHLWSQYIIILLSLVHVVSGKEKSLSQREVLGGVLIKLDASQYTSGFNKFKARHDANTFFFNLFFTLKKDKNPVTAVGTLLGAMTGALIGQETESGFIRGAAVGAISGAVFSIEVFEYSLLLWQSDESGVRCLLYLVRHLASYSN